MIPSTSLLASAIGAPTISISNRTASKVVVNGTATATYTINADGGVYINGGASPVENWISDPSQESHYDVQATLVSGTSPSGSALATWLSPTAGWSLVNAAKDNSVISCVLTVKIREHASGTVKATATITISAESDSLA